MCKKFRTNGSFQITSAGESRRKVCKYNTFKLKCKHFQVFTPYPDIMQQAPSVSGQGLLQYSPSKQDYLIVTSSCSRNLTNLSNDARSSFSPGA